MRTIEAAPRHVAPVRALVERCASVRLDAYSGNPRAVALYRRRGYRDAGQVLFPRRALPFFCFERAPIAASLR